jgi:fumarylacetoacetase
MHPNDPALRSFIDVDPTSDFPIQNLPYGVFSIADTSPRVGVAIGNFVLDLAAIEAEGLLDLGSNKGIFAQPSINAFMALGPKVWSSTRARISALLRHDNPALRDNDALRARR